MLKNIQPNRKRSKAGSLSEDEKRYSKSLFNKGYVVQDIAFIINQGRDKTVNQSVVQLCINNKNIKLVSDERLEYFLRVQSSYDPITLLNPYKDPRLIRARDTMIAAVQAFNSPAINFKTEIFCVLANIAWTYLIHEKMEQTKKGSSKLSNGNSVTVSGTLEKKICPIKNDAVKKNLEKIIEIRDAVEHTFFVGGEDCFGLLFQACCINFENYMTDWFGEHLSMSKELSLALQFVRLSKEQVVQIEATNFPKKIKAIHDEIQSSCFSNNNAFQLNVHYSTEVTSKTHADIHKLISYDENMKTTEVVVKKQKMTNLSQTQVVEIIKKAGYVWFGDYDHQCFWKTKWPTAKLRNQNAKEYGEIVYKKQWLWHEQTWLPVVLEFCKGKNEELK